MKCVLFVVTGMCASIACTKPSAVSPSPKPTVSPPPPKPTQPTDQTDDSVLLVLTDDKGGFYAIKDYYSNTRTSTFYYGNATTLWKQRGTDDFSGNRDKGTWGYDFWSPRVPQDPNVGIPGMRGSIRAKGDGHYELGCGTVVTALRKLSATESTTLLASAKLEEPFWKREIQVLARDNKGIYYIVDRMDDKHGGKGHRVFVGPKGAVKELQMTNIVADSAGEIYSTKRGELRLITSKRETLWIYNGAQQHLVALPPKDNLVLIYAELGIYPGSLGTPCDDAMSP